MENSTELLEIIESFAIIAVALLTVFGGAEGVVVAVQRLKRRLGWSGRAAQALAATASGLLALIVVAASGLVLPDMITLEWVALLGVAVWRAAEGIYQRLMRDG